MPTWIEVSPNGTAFKVEFSPNRHGTVYDCDRTVKTELPPNIKDYSCRSCGHNEFEPIHKRPRPGAMPGQHDIIGPGQNAGMPVEETHRIKGYRCPGCSVRFDDPVKWSAEQPAEVIPPVATPSPEEARLILWRQMTLEEIAKASRGKEHDPSHELVSVRLQVVVTKELPEGTLFACKNCGATLHEDTGLSEGLLQPCPGKQER